MRLLHYPDEASFNAAIAPQLAADPDANPRLLIKYPDTANGLRLSDSEKSIFLRVDHQGRWLPSGRDGAKAVELVKQISGTAPSRLFAHSKVATAILDFWGIEAHKRLEMNWYRLGTLAIPNKQPEGGARPATLADLDTLIELISGFDGEAMGVSRPREVLLAEIPRWIASGTMLVWVVNGQIVANAMLIPNGENLLRIGAVYTQPAWRSKGIAKALTTIACQLAIKSGIGVSLHADKTHSFTNQMYQSLGFEYKGEHTEYRFTA